MNDHYFSEDPKSKFVIHTITAVILGKNFKFLTAPGVFSREKIDKGTYLLAESMIIKLNSKLLDIGCGIGIIGIVAAKCYNADTILTDINKRAIYLARKNMELNEVKGKVLQGDLYEKIKDEDFDVIISNPPQNAGKEICFRLIEDSKKYLKKGGTLQIVARPNKGGKALAKKMEDTFKNVKIIAKKSGHCVYFSLNL